MLGKTFKGLTDEMLACLALRFTRVRRYRPDKAPAASDTFEMVQALYRQMTGLAVPLRRG